MYTIRSINVEPGKVLEYKNTQQKCTEMFNVIRMLHKKPEGKVVDPPRIQLVNGFGRVVDVIV
jgi:hypothetical protein